MITFAQKSLRLAVLTGLSAITLSAMATPGHAAADNSSVSVRQSGGRLELVYTGTGVVNNVFVFKDSAGAILVDDSVNITPGGGCTTTADPTTVRCSVGVTRISANLGGASDRFNSTTALTGTVSGGDGFDTFLAGAAANGPSAITFVGGTGADTVSYEQSTDKVGVTLDNAANDGRGATANRAADRDNAQVEHITGSRFGDTLTGDAGGNQITGNAGADTMRALGGPDLIRAADDQSDLTIDCGADNDRVAFDSAKDSPFSNCEVRFPQ